VITSHQARAEAAHRDAVAQRSQWYLLHAHMLQTAWNDTNDERLTAASTVHQAQVFDEDLQENVIVRISIWPSPDHGLMEYVAYKLIGPDEHRVVSYTYRGPDLDRAVASLHDAITLEDFADAFDARSGDVDRFANLA
jgi:hypothetical protein